MAVKVLIVGESGAGKSASLRNFDEKEVAIFNVSEKPLPFRKKLPMMKTSDMKTIAMAIKRNDRNCYVVDDAGLAMSFYLFGKVNEKGYDKFTQVAKDFYEMVQAVDDCSIAFSTVGCCISCRNIDFFDNVDIVVSVLVKERQVLESSGPVVVS